MKSYEQLTALDMIKLETLLEEGYTGGEIALRLGKDKTTIYRCLVKNR